MYMFPDRYKYIINKRYVYNGMECFSQYIKDNYTSMFTTPKKKNKKKITTDKILKIWCQKFKLHFSLFCYLIIMIIPYKFFK